MIQENLQRLTEELPTGVVLVAVSKTFAFSDIQIAYAGGHRHFGENKVQELVPKAQAAKEQGMDICWHFIGRLQSNKLKKLLAVPGLEAIHSIASMKQIIQLKKLAPEQKQVVKILLQVNMSQEVEKAGFNGIEELQSAITGIDAVSDKFPLVGLMTIGAIRTTDFAEAAAKCFGGLKSIQEQIGPHLQLSMGMSQDYQIALAYGTHYIRVGSKIFGKRDR